VRFGWFLWKGLQLEPEVMFTIPIGEDKGDMAYFLAGHLVYNFKASPKLVPFVGGGAGIGNGIPFLGWVEGSSDAKHLVHQRPGRREIPRRQRGRHPGRVPLHALQLRLFFGVVATIRRRATSTRCIIGLSIFF
jgi:hypothetical protein